VYLAGHSLGGSVAPRVAAATAAGPAVAGMIILAGGAEPLHWSAVRQFRYLATVSPGGPAAIQPALDAITAQAQAVDDPGLSTATPAAVLPFGIPAPYWLDLRGYDPPAAAAALHTRMLIVQGGRDYQVTTGDDLSRWQAALTGRKDVTIRVYDADNHLFFPGSGPSSPAEYEPAQHMDPEVIAGVASWLQASEDGFVTENTEPDSVLARAPRERCWLPPAHRPGPGVPGPGRIQFVTRRAAGFAIRCPKIYKPPHLRQARPPKVGDGTPGAGHVRTR
jgi:hypothetical protein